MTERLDDLRLTVFEDGKGVLIEVGNHPLLVVDDGGVQQHFLHIGMKNESAGVGTRLLSGRWRLLRG